ncbi:KEOPS complex Pcc1-like subunit [Sulfodiicoccus acidiphilus]|uniref:KEOPS complex Pcc1-like subunit n=1 Tax=Sulfodiicoccus acidiphilus TaxID=1670455 RepID=A0A348B131_9CREN|nr:hypothetical protein [Sulfodiicoccus acidiphilus]BBD71883.1 KEOPS complex Pcc1-like subunit [Sulfodiicoccus acidiphilus]GGT91190.1 KEOPS complex Pcc1-like subunit [Sulfodiicoccus acidiphilus]
MDEVQNVLKIKIRVSPSSLTSLALNSILLEEVDRGLVTVDPEKGEVSIKAPRLSRGRAIMNSYIYWLYTILTTFEELGEEDGRESTA